MCRRHRYRSGSSRAPAPLRGFACRLAARLARGRTHKAQCHIPLARFGRPPLRNAPAASTAGFDHEDVAGTDRNADLLGLEHARLLSARMEDIAMRQAVLAAEDAAGAVAYAVTGGVAESELFDLRHHLEHAAGAAMKFAVAAGVRTELVAAEEQRKSHLRHLEAAELDTARCLPFAGAGPTFANGRGAAAGARLEHMPNESAT